MTVNFCKHRKEAVVLIPAYNPTQALLYITKELLDSEALLAVVIVNDGSAHKYASLFNRLTKIKGVYLINHQFNRGKGAALKTGLKFIETSFPDSIGIVTADADGQHITPDIIKIAQNLSGHSNALTLGVRSFDERVPFRSRFGNTVTKQILTIVTGLDIQDSQTGLRGIPLKIASELTHLSSNGYDFEMEMLLHCQFRHYEIDQVEIKTIYINNNCSSHFNPFIDSIRIYLVILRFWIAQLFRCQSFKND